MTLEIWTMIVVTAILVLQVVSLMRDYWQDYCAEDSDPEGHYLD